ncbi:MAG: DUF4907 domain-containing protein [Bacteroidetes bacterium]|nr:MAG: DUF4907 domain-containing protein [Bacteroidota bacterium]
MQKLFSQSGYFNFSVYVLILSGYLILLTGCRNTSVNREKDQSKNKRNNVIETDPSQAYIKYSSFQNIDSTWGFTVFVNSRPSLYIKKIPVPGAFSGFLTKTDAEKIADLFVKMIRKGDLNPELNERVLDSLKILLKLKE